MNIPIHCSHQHLDFYPQRKIHINKDHCPINIYIYINIPIHLNFSIHIPIIHWFPPMVFPFDFSAKRCFKATFRAMEDSEARGSW